jgi:hypothetical protein
MTSTGPTSKAFVFNRAVRTRHEPQIASISLPDVTHGRPCNFRIVAPGRASSTTLSLTLGRATLDECRISCKSETSSSETLSRTAETLAVMERYDVQVQRSARSPAVLDASLYAPATQTSVLCGTGATPANTVPHFPTWTGFMSRQCPR